MKRKVVRLFTNMLNFKDKEDCNKIDGTNKTCNFVFVNSLVGMNPDKHCTWSKVSLKQIVLKIWDIFWDLSQLNRQMS